VYLDGHLVVGNHNLLFAPVNNATADIELPVDLTFTFLQHKAILDSNLGTVPHVI